MMGSETRVVHFLRPIPLVLFLAGWEILVRGNERLIFFFGQPSRVAQYVFHGVKDGSLLVDAGATSLEAALGFLLGNIIGTAIGLSLWYSKLAFQIARPYIIALGSAPIFALAPLVIVWFGTGLFAKIMMAALSTVFIALLQSYTGAAEVSKDYLRLMKTFGATKNQTFRKVVAPAAIAWVTAAFKLNVGFAILGAFIGEFISSNKGLGHMIIVASGLFDISLVLCGVLMLVCIALIFTWLVSKLEAPLKHIFVRHL